MEKALADHSGQTSGRDGADGVDAANPLSNLVGKGLPAGGDVGAVRQEMAVGGQPQGRLENYLRDRLSAADTPLQSILLSEAETTGKENGRLDLLFRRGEDEQVADDAIGLEEGAQHAMRAERAKAPQHAADRLRSLGDPRLPVRLVHRNLFAQLGAVLVLFGEEELELEEVAQPHRRAPELGRAVADAGLRRAQQRELRDRAVDEEVDDR